MIKFWHEDYALEVQELIEYSALAYNRDLTSAMGGNISMRCKDGVLITASNASLRNITPQTILLVDEKGVEIQNPYGLKPSKETKMHLAIYAIRPEVNCVMHLHPPYATAFSACSDGMPLVTESARGKIGIIPVVPVENPGSTELAIHTEKTLEAAGAAVHVLLLEEHGIVAFGGSIDEAFCTAELTESNARTAYYMRGLGVL